MSEKKETAVTKKDEHSVEFIPFGGSDKLRLTASMVRQFIAVPTKSGALPTERDCVKFIMLCLGKRANPFEGDVFLIGYDTKNGPSFSMVCGIELFHKRASAEEAYDGNESGVIVQGPEGTAMVTERPGTMVMDGEKLIGGWAKVYRKDRKQVEYKSVKFSTYDTGYSRWEKDPGGQIAKVALSQALRSAFPTPLGALYTQEEMQRVTETGEGLVAAREPVSMPKELPASEDNIPMGDSPDPSLQEQVSIAWAEFDLSEGKLITLLRHDKIIGEFDDLSKISDEDAAKVLKTIGDYAKRIGPAK